MDKYIGRLLDNRYEILEVIGTGGMAVVYKARCHRLNRLVAIKILKDEYSQDEEFRRRFHAESQAVAMLSHPNIVSVYDVSTTAGADYIVMELIDGITLKQYMEKKGVLNWKETLHFAIQIAKALEHAHSRGIVHRDIKPHNVMVLKNGSVKVADFGIARVMSKTNTLTKEALGSVHYISPEQAKGGRVDNRSDLYSLGVVMYEMITGRPPYDGESPVSVAIQHINGGAPMPSTLNPNIPGGLEQIIVKAMSVDPNNRYPSATAMLNDMDEFRRNPSMLFEYNGSAVDDALKIQSAPAQTYPEQPRPRNTAERMAGTATSGNPPRPPRRPTPADLPRRPVSGSQHRRNEDEQEEKRSRMTTIAVVSCSAVLVIAIVAILVSVMFRQPKQKLVQIPALEGQYYEEVIRNTYEGITIIKKTSYDETHPKGQIIDQNPQAGTQVFAGNEVIVTVSLGSEPKEKVMEDLTGLTEQNARKFLDDLKLNLVILPKMEANSTVPLGSVIRTDPADKQPLTSGQTVTLWISSGPEVIKKQMPKVIGLKYDTAREVLNKAGFKNVDYERVESVHPEDEVVEQSVDKGEMTDVTTMIILKISKGPEETTIPPTTVPPTTEAPTEPPATEAPTQPNVELTMRVKIDLPKDRTEPYVLSLRYQGNRVVSDLEIQPGTYSIFVDLIGSGTQTYELFIDDVKYKDIVVEFTVDG